MLEIKSSLFNGSDTLQVGLKASLGYGIGLLFLSEYEPDFKRYTAGFVYVVC